MSEGNQTWPEQNAVDEWCEKHAAKGPLGSWYIYADFNILMELKKAVTAYRITVDKERDALKARVVELEQSDNETIKALSAKVASLSAHETCACSVDTPEDVCMHHSPEVMRLRKRVTELKSRLEITNGEPADKIDCMAETIKIQDANVDRLRATVSEQQDIIFAMRATLERLRVIELPEITQDIEKKLWTELIDCTDCDCTALEWSQTAKDFVALLNEARALTKAKGE